jgi:hypothetical protein
MKLPGTNKLRESDWYAVAAYWQPVTLLQCVFKVLQW